MNTENRLQILHYAYDLVLKQSDIMSGLPTEEDVIRIAELFEDHVMSYPGIKNEKCEK